MKFEFISHPFPFLFDSTFEFEILNENWKLNRTLIGKQSFTRAQTPTGTELESYLACVNHKNTKLHLRKHAISPHMETKAQIPQILPRFFIITHLDYCDHLCFEERQICRTNWLESAQYFSLLRMRQRGFCWIFWEKCMQIETAKTKFCKKNSSRKLRVENFLRQLIEYLNQHSLYRKFAIFHVLSVQLPLSNRKNHANNQRHFRFWKTSLLWFSLLKPVSNLTKLSCHFSASTIEKNSMKNVKNTTEHLFTATWCLLPIEKKLYFVSDKIPNVFVQRKKHLAFKDLRLST